MIYRAKDGTFYKLKPGTAIYGRPDLRFILCNKHTEIRLSFRTREVLDKWLKQSDKLKHIYIDTMT